MMDTKISDLNKYMSKLSSALDCPSQIKNRLMKRTRRMANDFYTGNPNASWEDVRTFLGEPTDLAEAMLECEDLTVIESYRARKKRLKRFLMAILLSALVIVTCAFIYVYWVKSQPLNIQVQEKIVIQGDLTYVGK